MTRDPLDAVAVAAALLRQDGDPAVQAIGDWLAGHATGGEPGDLFEALGVDGCRGHSAGDRARRARRDQWLRDASPGRTPAQLAAALRHYAATAWRYERARAENPHPSGTLKATFWEVMKLVDHAPGEKQMTRIISRLRTVY